MARSDLIVNLARAGSQGDQSLFRRTLEALIAEERAKQHHILADRLSEFLKLNGSITPKPSVTDDKVHGALLELSPQHTVTDLILPPIVLRACMDLIEEHRRRDLLRSHGLEPRNRVLLAGPPGNGKTSLAEALASELMRPLYVVRYEGVIASYLGETAVRLRHLFDYIRTRECVLFFDEFDTIGKERGDLHETGEIKRVVSSLLLQVDALPSYVVIVTATNHPELLDRAVWRRFQLRLHLPTPGQEEIHEWFRRFEEQSGLRLGIEAPSLMSVFRGASFAELREFTTDILRRYVLRLPEPDLSSIVATQMEQWKARLECAPFTKDRPD